MVKYKAQNERLEAEHKEKLLLACIHNHCQKLIALHKSIKPNDDLSGLFSGME